MTRIYVAAALLCAPAASRAAVGLKAPVRPVPAVTGTGAVAVRPTLGLGSLASRPPLASVAGLALSPSSIEPAPAAAPAAPGQTADGAAAPRLTDALASQVLALQAPEKTGGPSRSASLRAVYDGSTPMVKPVTDWWVVGGRGYASTADLVSDRKHLGKSREAIYHYRHTKKKVSPAEYRFNVAALGASAGLIGATSGALLWMFSSLTTMGMPDFFLITGFFGGTLGLTGLLIGALEGGKPSVNTVTGRLRIIGKRLRFYARGTDDKTVAVVNLNAYARARTPRSAPLPAPQSPLLGALKGLGLGLGVAASMMIPFVMAVTIPLMGPGVAWDIGRRLSRRSHAVGGVLGGALGLLVPLSYFAALALGGAQNPALMGVWAGGLGLIGAALGAALINRLNRADAWAKTYAPKGQWWNREP